MSQLDALLKLIAAFDLVALDPAAWTQVCNALAVALRAQGAMILGEDMRSRLAYTPHSESIADYVRAYVDDDWSRCDIRADRGFPHALRCDRVGDRDIVAEDEMRDHPFYAELLRPRGLPWFGATAVSVEGRVWMLAALRTPEQGEFNGADLDILAGLREHFGMAIRRSTLLGTQRLENLEATFSSAGHGLFTVDATGRVSWLNTAAETLLAEAGLLENRRIRSGDELEARAARTLVTSAATGAVPLAPLPPPVHIRTQAGRHLVLDAVSMPRTFEAILARTAAVVTVREVADDLPVQDTLRASFGLTAREAEVAEHLLDGQGLAEAATTIGTSIATVRQHLKAIFRKTDTHRQGELVALLARRTRG